jgi:hypothetical protein
MGVSPEPSGNVTYSCEPQATLLGGAHGCTLPPLSAEAEARILAGLAADKRVAGPVAIQDFRPDSVDSSRL